jgi:hypothetical protein
MDAEAEPEQAPEGVEPGQLAAVENGKADKQLQVPAAPSSKPAAASSKPAAASKKPAAASKKPAAASKKSAAASTTLTVPSKKPTVPAKSPDGEAVAAAGATAWMVIKTLLGLSGAPPANTEVGKISSESLSDIIAATQRLGVDPAGWDFKQLTSLIQQADQYQRELHAQEYQAAANRRELEAEAEAKANEYKLATRETNVRFAIALILVLGAVVGVFAGIVVGHNAGEVAQYLAPITGLAGIAVGYFFGRASQ